MTPLYKRAVDLSLPPGAEPPLTNASAEYLPHPPQSENRMRWTKHAEKHPVSSFIPLPTSAPSPIPRIQHDFPSESWLGRRKRVNRQKVVKEAFEHAWKGYKTHAWLRDELSPLSARHRNTFAGWAATLVDALDSLVIMGMEDEFQDALHALEKIDFTMTDATQINVFETIIRYVGGLLGAYDLTDGRYPILLKKAVELADMIYAAFDTKNRMPQSRWQWTRSAQGLAIQPSRNTILAELGSLNLEFTRLSQLTKDPKYYDAVQRIMNLLEDAQNRTKIPGLWPMMVNAIDLEFTDPRFTIGGMADSTYEYLPKEHMLLGAQTNQFQKMYAASMDSIKKYLLFRPMTKDGQDILFAGNVHTSVSTKIHPEPQWEHLKCFFGGTVGIGAKVFDRPEELSIARKLTDGCIWAYDVMPTGIMPETLQVSPCQSMESCEWDEQQWYQDVRRRLARGSKADDTVKEAKAIIKEKGLQPGVTEVSDGRYLLRPEAIESVFIMYRITGDKKLQDDAWRMFQNIEKMTRTKYAHAAIDDVRNAHSAQLDYMESFWLAETLKYFYLIFSEPDLVSLDEYVLNTEAHPFKRPSTRT
ncbi:glycoside hydrolase family 47 protein [Aspergillus clavatus NRRL 1]|uniref:alpha-1,2-Mannosidase n=1 Tax=Aspergillus clavatus (strain ATCC 1007 / CBS 513.65 / DSM 816 / NCTC 3887 / NRRL 1 / QM 1276 / 107) TaxID=344612 RepID=A1CHV2_ASPCL|nr:class I alpha-mannosidase [Aspergillus clavatus NRRL 1]EAW10457.1 class I alpha-mannosidase [Aspergillus clavatus NRRL 1]